MSTATATPGPGREQRSAGVADFPLLDALRGLAALGVLVYHVAFQALALNGGPLEALAAPLAQGEVGIAIFFALSGFLLYRPYGYARLARSSSIPSGRLGARSRTRAVSSRSYRGNSSTDIRQ